VRAGGADPSLTGTGIATADGTAFTVRSRLTGDNRLTDIDMAVRSNLGGLHLVCMEDLPTHAHGAGLTGLASGVVRLALLQMGVPYIAVVPSSLKVYATGKGTCTKADMRMELFRRTELDVRDDNQVDAIWLRHLALDLLGEPEIKLPQTHRRALDKVGEIGTVLAVSP
jgi:Holliday junction resolvasome RuvABC endonuclease subunit